MIKVLIVEDDKLVRMGLVHAMPWKAYGMEVVGDVSHGQEALTFMEHSEVDCVITDLEMPIMSGIELMHVLRKRYPSVQIVVLTLHKDFEYIQEALRLGAIDYIAKVQLDKEQFEVVLERLQRLIAEKRRAERPASPADIPQDGFSLDFGYALFSLQDTSDIRWLESVDGAPPFDEIGNAAWFLAPDSEEGLDRVAEVVTKALRNRAGWTLVRIEGIRGRKPQEVYSKLRTYRGRDYFYDFDDAVPATAISFDRIAPHVDKLSEAAFESLKAGWLSFDWIADEKLFEIKKEQLMRLRLPSEKLNYLLYEIVSQWNRRYSTGVLPSELILSEPTLSWQETEQWLARIRTNTIELSKKLPYSIEVVCCITKAARIVEEELERPLFAVNVAKRVNMSRSYFNQCFKDIIGCSFNEYVRATRLEKAKNYLLHTTKPIQWIAERTGYSDEKYFARVFRQLQSMTPTEFRSKHRRGSGESYENR
ncbi:response regulator [Paenibacillus sp.]|uniref:response regulator transcription factor n=1 Tax=Paenibacillus sp. TaxID=58172 RepID=UPI002D6C780B|nr:response regulator [Paenibacillus sp.]HZG86711.1 response regulator [Paenibacillus sp.]